MKRFIAWFRHFRILKTKEQALKLNLKFECHVLGETFEKYGIKSLWTDKYANVYYCQEEMHTFQDLKNEPFFKCNSNQLKLK